jgi:hypothetical protein
MVCRSAARILAVVVLTSVAIAGEHHHGGFTQPVVSPVDEITILDPGTDPEGKPSPLLYTGPGNQQQVDIPPTVIVHNYYYSGDRDFRGPVFTGGPSILVVNHPLSGERLYLPVQMLPGSPRITYRKQHIDYDFGEDRIRVRFLHPLKVCDRDTPTVSYLRGREFRETTMESAQAAGGHVRQWVDRTGIPHATHHVAAGAVGALDTSADRFRDVGRIAVGPAVRIAEATPAGRLLIASPEERAARVRDEAVQRAERVNRLDDLTIRTLR